MSFRTTLTDHMKTAMKAREQLRLDTLRFVLSQAKNQEIDLKRELTDEEWMKLIQKEVKNRVEAIEQFKTGGRDELVKEETEKLAVLQGFLPAEMSDEELEKIVKKIVEGAGDKNFGLVMKQVMAETKGQVDGKRVSEMVKNVL